MALNFMSAREASKVIRFYRFARGRGANGFTLTDIPEDLHVASEKGVTPFINACIMAGMNVRRDRYDDQTHWWILEPDGRTKVTE